MLCFDLTKPDELQRSRRWLADLSLKDIDRKTVPMLFGSVKPSGKIDINSFPCWINDIYRLLFVSRRKMINVGMFSTESSMIS